MHMQSYRQNILFLFRIEAFGYHLLAAAQTAYNSIPATNKPPTKPDPTPRAPAASVWVEITTSELDEEVAEE